MRIDRLGIVGHAAEKFTAKTERLARRAILRAARATGASTLISGGSPMGGVDLWTEQVAAETGLEMIVHRPVAHRWDGPSGFKERNMRIARDSDAVIVVVVTKYPEGFSGMAFRGCYHCNNDKSHIKSGACWTARQAMRQGRLARWCLIHPNRVEFLPWQRSLADGASIF